MSETKKETLEACYHCGEPCKKTLVRFDEKSFCCDGCKVVFELLQENDLCSYYNFEEKGGISPKIRNFEGRFAFLDDQVTAQKLLRFASQDRVISVFHLPQMHCSSCVWLLEHLYKLNPGILSSRTNFLQKEITIEFNPGQTSIRSIVELLTTLGYEPLLSLDDLSKEKPKNTQRKRIYRIAVTGFCFANIMMLSFPEYFHIAEEGDAQLQETFTYLNLLLSIPALVFGGGEFFISAWKSIRAKYLNIDVPLVLSIVLTFSRSLYEIVSGSGAGYLDSMSGIIFFMLVGRFFQEKTHYNLQFDRNYKSFFPISIMLKKADGKQTSIPLPNLRVADVMIIHSQEMIPADSKLLSDAAYIDYSFVTGESKPIKINRGELIYAGGKQTGGSIECEVLKDVSQSYLTELWNREAFSKEKNLEGTFIDRLAKHFTIFLLALSIGAYIWWLPIDPSRGLDALTTVLIVACPCALLLSATFTNGAMMRIFSRNKFYLKNPSVIESLSKVNHIVMDKTGTVTNNSRNVQFIGKELNEAELSLVYSVCRHSNHPLSKTLASTLSFCDAEPTTDYTEKPGGGVSARIRQYKILIGSAKFCGALDQSNNVEASTQVFVSIDQNILGYFAFETSYRQNAQSVFEALKKRFRLAFISGDNESDKKTLQALAGNDTEMRFFQTPNDKLDYVQNLQQKGSRIAMIGDGLNDAGALKQSEVGIAISDDINNFSPACDAIIEGSAFAQLDKLFSLSRISQNIIKASFVLSLLYNIIGLSIAVQGNMSPVIAAILMPVSSISIILFTNSMSEVFARRLGLKS